MTTRTATFLRPRALALALLPVLWTGPATAADDCTKKLQIVTSLPMTDFGNLVTVPVSLNGVEKQFLYDTGGFFPQVSSDIVDELKLPRLQSPVEIYATDGSVSKKSTRVPTVAFGALKATNYELPITPNKGLDGIFAPVAFKAYDFDMDFANHKLNILWGDHCDGRVIYWPAKAIAQVPITTRDLHITVPVTVDGHNLTAIIDTGASTSTLRLDIAKYIFKLDPTSPDMKVTGHLGDDEKALIYSYPFKTLSFEGVTVGNPRIRILTDVVNKNADQSYQTGSHIKKVSDDLTLPEVIIGMDVLRKLHLYLANKERRLYLTEASTPADTIAPAP